MNKYIFTVVTNEYAGNFERELTAYVTGAVGESGVGGKFARLFRQHLPDNDLVESMIEQLDEHGMNYCQLAGKGAKSVEIHFSERPPFAVLTDRAEQFPKLWAKEKFGSKKLEILAIRLESETVTRLMISQKGEQ